MRNCFVWLIALLSYLPMVGWPAGQDCELATRYYQLSNTAKSEYRVEDAYTFLERAATACPSYQYLQEMGEIATEFGDPMRDQRAAEVFGDALALAATDAERARSIARYAELLFHDNDPQNAMNYIAEARNLDSDSAWITQLAGDIADRAARVTPEDIKRGLADMAFKPLRLSRTLPEAGLTSTGSGGAGSAQPQPGERAGDRRSINIQLNFRVNSTVLDEITQNNVNVLAETLVQDEFAGQQFLLIGHADVRGTADHNLALSVQRANAINAEIERLQPGLAGRIMTSGRGMEEPLVIGTTAADHRINRRLEVVLVQLAD